MSKYRRKITEEQYKRALTNRGCICAEDMDDIFLPEEQCGYGIYCTQVDLQNGEYIVNFEMGDSCD